VFRAAAARRRRRRRPCRSDQEILERHLIGLNRRAQVDDDWQPFVCSARTCVECGLECQAPVGGTAMPNVIYRAQDPRGLSPHEANRLMERVWAQRARQPGAAEN